MTRWLQVPVVLASLGFHLALPAASAQPQNDNSCSFALSAPQHTTLPGGATGITATAQATKCAGMAQPVKVTVCLSSPAGAAVCDTKYAWVTAKAFLGSTQPGEKFTVTGTGCSLAPDPDADSAPSAGSCQSLGPLEDTV
jgi:hypothetical protein